MLTFDFQLDPQVHSLHKSGLVWGHYGNQTKMKLEFLKTFFFPSFVQISEINGQK